jgi:hypothetical protein
MVAVRPGAEDPYPGVLPPGVHVVDVPQTSDGSWHEYMLLESPEGAALWVDRQKQFLVDAKDIVQWPHSRFHLWGFGLGAAGGAWEFKDVVMTRKKLD